MTPHCEISCAYINMFLFLLKKMGFRKIRMCSDCSENLHTVKTIKNTNHKKIGGTFYIFFWAYRLLPFKGKSTKTLIQKSPTKMIDHFGLQVEPKTKNDHFGGRSFWWVFETKSF